MVVSVVGLSCMNTETGVSGIESLDSGVKKLKSWSTGVDEGGVSSQRSSPVTFSCSSLSGKAREAGRGGISSGTASNSASS